MTDFQGSNYQDYLDMSPREFPQEGRCWKCGIETSTGGIYCSIGYCKLVHKSSGASADTFSKERQELADSGYSGLSGRGA